MNIGIICYASAGGSGVVAAELAKALAAHNHQVSVFSTDPPFRLGHYQPGVTFHRVETPGYPLFREPQYLLALANKIVQVARERPLDIVHAHYAIPHAAAAYLARNILSASNDGAPKVITTLHGTDITLLGSDPSYMETVAFCINESDGVTAVSEDLKRQTLRELPVHTDIRVIYNFLQCDVYTRMPDAALRECYCPRDRCQKLVVHVSNFRPVKRVTAVVDVFKRIRARVNARLLLVGDGPDLPDVRRHIGELGLKSDVEILGEQDQLVPVLSEADLFLLPSAQESFGLAALEAMACRVPVVASRVGGLPEVIEHGVNGFLHEMNDLDGMAESGIALLTDDNLHARVAARGRRTVEYKFCAERIVPVYEAYYREVLAK
ncbi:MAG: N-acetyl-alpha-D-glucosaminyl L-malate synthase BshA [Bacteroidales bacterium]